MEGDQILVNSEAASNAGPYIIEDSDSIYYSDSASDSETDLEKNNCSLESNDLSFKLGEWTVQHNVQCTALGDLLKLLHEYHPNLPVDPRTVLHTPRVNKSTDHKVNDLPDGGQYVHFGIEPWIKSYS